MDTKCTMLGVTELSRDEEVMISGGGKLFDTLGVILGYTANFFSDACNAWSSTPEGAACQQALSDFH